MISFGLFFATMIILLGTSSALVVYGGELWKYLAIVDNAIGYRVRTLPDYKERRRQKARVLAEQRVHEYREAMHLERQAHRREVRLSQLNQEISWERRFHGGELPSHLNALETELRQMFALPAPKQVITEQPLIPDVLEQPSYGQYKTVDQERFIQTEHGRIPFDRYIDGTYGRAVARAERLTFNTPTRSRVVQQMVDDPARFDLSNDAPIPVDEDLIRMLNKGMITAREVGQKLGYPVEADYYTPQQHKQEMKKRMVHGY